MTTGQAPLQTNSQAVTTALGKIHIALVKGTGVPIVCWPSIFYDRSLFFPLAQHLAQPLILIDGPGHGKSELNRPQLTMQDCVQVLVDVLDHCEIEAAVVAGVSWGGVVAAEFMVRHPRRGIAAVLMNTPFAMPAQPSLSTQAIVAMTRLIPTWAMFKNGVARSFFSQVTQETHSHVVEAFLAQPDTFSNPGLHTAVRAVLIERASLLSSLSQIYQPTLVIAGADDKLYHVADIRAAAENIPTHRFEVVADSGHISAVERVDITAQLIKSFLSGCTD